MKQPLELRQDAETIWRAGVAAVDSRRLVRDCIHFTAGELDIGPCTVPVGSVDRLVVLGTGKAGAGMAAGVEDALRDSPFWIDLAGWVNVPADCVRALDKIHLHPARPAGVNEPTAAGVAGSERILELARSMTARNVGIVLISGGGSALLPAPVPAISLADKLQVTRVLSAAGATIQELNLVRRQLSRIKGGGLARACSGGTLITLIISDVSGDPLETIASGPTIPTVSTPAAALSVLKRYDPQRKQVPVSVWQYLSQRPATETLTEPVCDLITQIIGNNRTAVKAAADQALALGYDVQLEEWDRQGEAATTGRELLQRAFATRDSQPVQPVCLISGGEPVVQLAETSQSRKGGRNQELALAALDAAGEQSLSGIVLLSGGTDGEDGPTDAAGAIADQLVQEAARWRQLATGPFLAINNSYPFFQATGGLLQTGPTHTNVMDLRVVLVDAER